MQKIGFLTKTVIIPSGIKTPVNAAYSDSPSLRIRKAVSFKNRSLSQNSVIQAGGEPRSPRLPVSGDL